MTTEWLGGPRSSASLQLAPRPRAGTDTCGKSWRWGFCKQSGSPRLNRGGRPPTTTRWGHAENKKPASLASQHAFLSSSQPPLGRRRVFPFHRTDPAVKAHGCSSACLRLQGETPTSDRKKGRVARELEGDKNGALDSFISALRAVCKTG